MNDIYTNNRTIADFKKEHNTTKLNFWPLKVEGQPVYYKNEDKTNRLYKGQPVQKLKVRTDAGEFIADVHYTVACDWFNRQEGKPWATRPVVVSDRLYAPEEGEIKAMPQVRYADLGEDSGL